MKDKLAECDGVLPLPVIRNKKTVNPTDPDSEQVIQLETAMGAAIGLFNGSICVQVDRMRFLPVKTTNDLFIMRSDRFHLTDTYEMEDGNYIFPTSNLIRDTTRTSTISTNGSPTPCHLWPQPTRFPFRATGHSDVTS